MNTIDVFSERPFVELPIELNLIIFGFLSIQHRAAALSVCTVWQKFLKIHYPCPFSVEELTALRNVRLLKDANLIEQTPAPQLSSIAPNARVIMRILLSSQTHALMGFSMTYKEEYFMFDHPQLSLPKKPFDCQDYKDFQICCALGERVFKTPIFTYRDGPRSSGKTIVELMIKFLNNWASGKQESESWKAFIQKKVPFDKVMDLSRERSFSP